MESVTANCFHGKLDRRSAEERLSISSKFGAFLLRESDRKVGSFVLSYYGRTGINHFKVTNVCGSYFIGGKQFDSLTDLIAYYSSNCDLLTGERLLYPIHPPVPIVARDRLFISILPYKKLAQSDELSFKMGDMFYLQNDLGDGWLWCRDVRTGQSGLIFSDLVEEVQEDVDPNEVFPWFHAHLSKADAVNKLAQAGPGSFLVRPSDNSPGNYTLFYHVGSTVQRFLIVRSNENRYTMGGKSFDSLGQIIELYQEEQIIEGHILQYPVTSSLSRADRLSETTLSTSMRALEVRGKPEDIYNTVKISREAAKKRQSSQVKGWLCLKKGDLAKKWKSYYFVLNSRDNHLYYYEKPQQTKPKGLIDLSYSFIYLIHESLFQWSQCFQLIEKCLPCFANYFYIRCDDDKRDFERWVNTIKKFTSINQSTKRSADALIESNQTSRTKSSSDHDASNTFDERRSIHLTIVEGHSIKVSQPYFMLAYNRDIKVARTKVKASPTTTFGEDGRFALEDLPSDVKSLTVSVHQNSKKSKTSVELGTLSIDLTCLDRDCEQFDRWLKLQPEHSSEVLGCLRVKLHYSSEIIMGLPEYDAILGLVCDPSTEVLTILDHFCHRDHLTLARSLANILRYKKISTRILKTLIERDANFEPETGTLFRTNTLTAALLESYTRSMCRTALIKCLRQPIKKLLDDKISCELNPSKLDSHNVSQNACENLQNLLDQLDELVSNIYSSINYYPVQVRYLFSCLQKIVQRKLPDEHLVRTRVVSGFLFLRLICPTILNPKQFNLVNETPSENAIRNLTLVAKCLQSLANLVETSKESWMEVVNPFILKNKIGMVKFIDELCNVDFVDPILIDRPQIDPNNNSDFENADSLAEDELYDPARDLANIHNICESYISDLEQQAISSQAAKKLLTTLTILSKHKQYYVNLRRNARQNVNTSLI